MSNNNKYYYLVVYQANKNGFSLTGTSYITRDEEIYSFQHIADLKDYLEEVNGYTNLTIINFIRMRAGFDDNRCEEVADGD